jgi:tRNA modification GTPase
MNDSRDTIAAISSAVGPAARMIVRVSGREAISLAKRFSHDCSFEPSTASRGIIEFASLRVPATFYVFLAPHSYTGEDLIEFHIPGNALLARMLLNALISAGARQADPGEFTARAYFSGRIDLAKAEGVAATIAAHSEQELRAARQLLSGELARRLQPARELLIETLALVEAGIDFSDEDVSFISPAQLADRIARVDQILADVLESTSRFETLAREPSIVLAGRPNAGKSTLLNALAGSERAVTSPVAGTTRDILSADIALRRGIVRIIDAAGLDERAQRSGIESQMHEKALRAIEQADAVVLLQDATDARPPVQLPRDAELFVRTKSDLPHVSTRDLAISAVTGQNLEVLRDELDKLSFGPANTGGASLALNARHVRSLGDARVALSRPDSGAAELVALDLREALDAIGQVLGVVTPDDVLGRVFSTFCIGK